MLTYALVLFGLGAVGGAAMALMHFKGKGIPMPIAVVHGLLGAAGLVALGILVLGSGAGGYLPLALGLFVVAALGGFVLFASHLRGKPLSTPLVGIHGLVAVVGFVLLLLSL